VKLVKLTGAKGASVWVAGGQVTHMSALDSGENSLYGSNNSQVGSRIAFVGGQHLDVREAPADVMAAFLDAG
jgi:hypothetical protein